MSYKLLDNYLRNIVLNINSDLKIIQCHFSHSLHVIKKKQIKVRSSRFLCRQSYLLKVLVVIDDLFANLHHVSRA